MPHTDDLPRGSGFPMTRAGLDAGGVTSPPLDVVTVQVGDRYPDFYVDRLRRMLARRLAQPHRLIVYSDRARTLSPEVTVRNCSGWGLDGYFNKLRLFDPEVTGERPFLYLDITLVITASLEPLLEQAGASSASLIAVDDWNYPGINSSVMWIRPDRCTRSVWDDYRSGRRYLEKLPSDQNYIGAVFQTRFPERLEFWEPHLVMSYRNLRKLAAHRPTKAREVYERGAILKFHGRPKPQEVLQPWRCLDATILRHPLRPRLWRYLHREIKSHWMAPEPAAEGTSTKSPG